MHSISFPFKYFAWHYTTAIADLFYITKNYFWGLSRFVGLKLLFRNLFRPIVPNILIYSDISGVERILIKLTTIISGFLFRFVIAILYLIICAVIFVISISIFAFWVLLPIFMVAMFISGITHLIVW